MWSLFCTESGSYVFAFSHRCGRRWHYTSRPCAKVNKEQHLHGEKIPPQHAVRHWQILFNGDLTLGGFGSDSDEKCPGRPALKNAIVLGKKKIILRCVVKERNACVPDSFGLEKPQRFACQRCQIPRWCRETLFTMPTKFHRTSGVRSVG